MKRTNLWMLLALALLVGWLWLACAPPGPVGPAKPSPEPARPTRPPGPTPRESPPPKSPVPSRPTMPTPLPSATIGTVINLWADDMVVQPGECTYLHWRTDYSQEVYLQEGANPEQKVPPQDKRWVCPPGTTIYRLRVVTPSGDLRGELTIAVAPYYY